MSIDDEGFEVPIHRSITEPILLAGLPRNVCLILWTTAMALAFGLRQLWVVPLALIAHFVLTQTTKSDVYFFDVFMIAIKAPKRLDP